MSPQGLMFVHTNPAHGFMPWSEPELFDGAARRATDPEAAAHGTRRVKLAA